MRVGKGLKGWLTGEKGGKKRGGGDRYGNLRAVFKKPVGLNIKSGG